MMIHAVAEQPSTFKAQESLRVLVGDDQADVLEALRLLLKGAGHQAVTVDSPAALLRASDASRFDLILMDLNYARDTTSGQEGLDLLSGLRAQGNTAPVVVMTAWGNIDLAVEAMRRGASDFVQKPWDNARLLETIRKQSRKRSESDMDLARHVQQKLFPQRPVAMRTLESTGKCVPAREVGGDYYDYLALSPSRTAFVLADVSGKGIASALLMANLQASFRSQSDLAQHDPAQLLAAVNRLFYDATPPEHYATLFYADYDESTRTLCYLNCGHPAAIVVREDRTVERLESTTTVLGLFPKWSAKQGRIELRRGDTLLLYSDGVSEAGGDSGEEFGEERLIGLLQAMRHETLDRILDRIISSVQSYSGAHQSDDITAILLRAI
ncbi:MAG: SpoIIE family protein phosphatase [Acidobacteriaceae bacterium]|nr:SpoIIE family protein phosphatase [Acidobacteriaceae bacterium]